MTNKTTKSSLLLSSVSLLLCFAMLLGTTFAWFTDSVTSANNIIKSGNLDIKLEHSYGFMDGPIEEVTSTTELFKFNKEGETILWEPGVTMVEYFTITNTGNLAFKFNFNLLADNATKTADGKTLLDVLRVQAMQSATTSEHLKNLNSTLIPDPTNSTTYELKDFAYEDYLLPEENVTFAVHVMWEPTNHDNDYNVEGGLNLDLGVNLTATQYTYEEDSYGNEYDKDAVYADHYAATADGLVEALEGANTGDVIALMNNIKIDPANMSNAYGKTGINIKNGQTLDGNGKTLDIQGAGGTWDSGINTTGGTIRNITVTGSFRGIFINHDSNHTGPVIPVILEKVITKGTTYTISCDQGMNQTLKAKDCEFYGWTSFAATLGNATFNNCKFGKGNGYAYCRPYAPTAFVDCDFEEGFKVDPIAAVTFENCTIDGVPLTADTLSTLVTSSNIANATVK